MLAMPRAVSQTAGKRVFVFFSIERRHPVTLALKLVALKSSFTGRTSLNMRPLSLVLLSAAPFRALLSRTFSFFM
jgi:hypothetical protein